MSWILYPFSIVFLGVASIITTLHLRWLTKEIRALRTLVFLSMQENCGGRAPAASAGTMMDSSKTERQE